MSKPPEEEVVKVCACELMAIAITRRIENRFFIYEKDLDIKLRLLPRVIEDYSVDFLPIGQAADAVDLQSGETDIDVIPGLHLRNAATDIVGGAGCKP